MTIRKGQEWGTLGPRPADAVVVRSDGELHELVVGARTEGRPIPTIDLRGGDLSRSVGGQRDDADSTGVVALLPCDLIRVDIDDQHTTWAAAHIVAVAPVLGSTALGWWRGGAMAVMNAQHLGSWDVAPRSHPNDGRVDLVTVDPSMSLRDRWTARRRLPLGTHVPHPAITIRPMREGTVDVPHGSLVRIDGVAWRHEATRLAVTVEPDAFVVCV